MKLRRSNDEAVHDEMAELDRKIVDVKERHAGGQSRIRELQGVLSGEDLDAIADARAELAVLEPQVEDAGRVLARLEGRRSKLVQEFKLSLLEPLRDRIAVGDARISELEAELAELRPTVAVARLALADAEDELRNATPTRDEADVIRWWVSQLRAGMFEPLRGQWAMVPRRVRRSIREQVANLNATLPVEAAAVHEHALQSWRQSGLTPTFPVVGSDPAPVALPDLDPVVADPYIKLG